jgi:hypothetical protein
VVLGRDHHMRRLYTLCPLAVAPFSASAQATRTQGAETVVGVWRMLVPSEAPSSCHDVSTEFRADGTMLTKSGALVATNTYSLVHRKGGWLLVMNNPRTNGKPNCQGLPAEFVVKHLVRREYVQVVGDTLRECNADSPVPDCLAMVRREVRQATPRPRGGAKRDR